LWSGFGPSAPFVFGGVLATISVLLMIFIMPETKENQSVIQTVTSKVENGQNF